MTEPANRWGIHDIDGRIRLAAFEFLAIETARRGSVLPWQVLSNEFRFEGQRVCLLGPQGIFKPELLPDMPISITTAPVRLGRQRPYDDQIGSDGVIRYRFRGDDAEHHVIVASGLAMQRQVPLIYFLWH